MHLNVLIWLGVIVASCSCSTTKEHAILKTLTVKERNSVHVALWTLQQNGVLSDEEFDKIHLRPPYREVRPQIRAVQKRVRALPEEKLSALDQSLSYYWSIYNIIWPSIYKWDVSVDEERQRLLDRLSNPQGRANGRQPFRPETNGTPPAAASHRAP
jgi:hypothetical protein